MMNFVTSVFKKYINKNETKTEIENHAGITAQSKNEPVRTEGPDESSSFSSLSSLSEKQNPEPNEYFQDAQEGTTISSVTSEMDRDNRDNLFISDSEGQVRGQDPDILCDTSSDEAILQRYDVSNTNTDGQENLRIVLPCAELDLLNNSSHGSDLSPQKVIKITDDDINNQNMPKLDSSTSDSNKNISSLDGTDQKSGATTKNEYSENDVAIGNKLVSLSDILGNNSVPATTTPSESNLHTLTTVEGTSECVAYPESALKALIHSVNNTLVMKSSETEAFGHDASYTQTDDTLSAIDTKNDTVSSATDEKDIGSNGPIKTVDSTADQQDFARGKIGNDILDENTDKIETKDIQLLDDNERESGRINVRNHDQKDIDLVPKLETSDMVTNSSKELDALDTVQSKPDNIIGRVADEVKKQKQTLEQLCTVKPNINENDINSKEITSNVKINDNNSHEYKVSHSMSENIAVETDDHEAISRTTDNSVETGSSGSDGNLSQIKPIQNTPGSEDLEVIDDDLKTEQPEPGNTSTTILESDKLREEHLEIKTSKSNEDHTVLNTTENQNKQLLSDITEIKVETMVLLTEKVNENEMLDTCNENTKKVASCESAISQNGKEPKSDDISCIQDSDNMNLPTILEESMTSTSSTSEITGVERAENTNNSKEGIIHQKLDKHTLAEVHCTHDLADVKIKAELNESVMDNANGLEKIEVGTADSAFSEPPSLEKYEPVSHKGFVTVSSTNTEQLETIDGDSTGATFLETLEPRKESINTNQKSLTVTTTHKSINSLEEFQFKSESNIDTEIPRHDTEKTMEKHSNKEEYKELTADNRIYERQDTQEFENLERQFEEQNLDVNRLQTADILEKLILESNNSNHNQPIVHRIKEREINSSGSIDKNVTSELDNIGKIQCADGKNLLHRQDTQEFEHFEKQCKEEHQLRNDNILEELVAECTDRNEAEENKDEEQTSLETETFDTDSDVKQVLLDKLPSSQTEIKLTCSDSNITMRENNNDQNSRPKENDGHVENENKKQNRKETAAPTKTSENKAENEETTKSSQNRTLAQPLTNENQNRNEELMSKVDLLQQELDTIRKRNKRKGKQTNPEFEEKGESNTNVISEYKNLLDEYEKQIIQQDNDLEEMKVKCEENVRRFTTTEMAFSDVFEKYEKAKYAITVYRKNEDILLENIQNAEEQLSRVETKCLSMKQQAAEQINRAHEQVEREKAKCKQEITKLQVQVKMLEIKAASLETAFNQKTDECRALAALCEDITGRNTTRA